MTKHITTLDGLDQAVQELKARLPGDTPVVMSAGFDPQGRELLVPVAMSGAKITKTAPKRRATTGGTPCVLIGRSR